MAEPPDQAGHVHRHWCAGPVDSWLSVHLVARPVAPVDGPDCGDGADRMVLVHFDPEENTCVKWAIPSRPPGRLRARIPATR